jgi:hypothetical protein
MGLNKHINIHTVTHTPSLEKLLKALGDKLIAQRTLITELRADSATRTAWQTEVDGDLDKVNDALDYRERDGVIGGNYAFATAAAVTVACTGRIRYRIGGIEYETAMPATLALDDGGNVTQNKYGCWRILIDATGTVTTLDTGTDPEAHNDTIDGLLYLSSRARTTGNIDIGYCTLIDTA